MSIGNLVALGLTLLQVLLERRGSRNGFTGILVIHGIGVTGISHTSLSNLLVDGGGAGELRRGGEGRGGGHKGSDGDKLELYDYFQQGCRNGRKAKR
eukprot:CAMPEP_0196175100 /NCGR_PEP_ID=MMETSP0911-20130528/7848_1 /TAXON_ID=49265 /ORGANISM="Thalassiosira rotula, Strain GSO102" /LENGTH=96 /DNA_ID=CAMNT_0041442591 /DNA_START=174 /DNA_END=464 /DNA_ORIENTATION=+